MYFLTFVSRRSTGEEDFKRWPHQTFITANCGRHLATGSTTATTCSPSPWKKMSLHSSPWTAPDTGKQKSTALICLHCQCFSYLLNPSRLSDVAAAWCLATGLAPGGSYHWGWLISVSCTETSFRGRWPVWLEFGASSRTMLTSSAGWIRWWPQ